MAHAAILGGNASCMKRELDFTHVRKGLTHGRALKYAGRYQRAYRHLPISAKLENASEKMGIDSNRIKKLLLVQPSSDTKIKTTKQKKAASAVMRL